MFSISHLTAEFALSATEDCLLQQPCIVPPYYSWMYICIVFVPRFTASIILVSLGSHVTWPSWLDSPIEIPMLEIYSIYSLSCGDFHLWWFFCTPLIFVGTRQLNTFMQLACRCHLFSRARDRFGIFYERSSMWAKFQIRYLLLASSVAHMFGADQHVGQCYTLSGEPYH